jgi:hypothetical protein
MAVIRRRNKSKPPERVARDVDEVWWRELLGYLPDGCAWNELSNGWLNEQYEKNISPKEVFDQLTLIEF